MADFLREHQKERGIARERLSEYGSLGVGWFFETVAMQWCWHLSAQEIVYITWGEENSAAINAWFRCRPVIYEVWSLAKPNRMRKRYVQALDLSPGFGDVSVTSSFEYLKNTTNQNQCPGWIEHPGFSTPR